MSLEQQLISKRAWLGPGGPEGFLIVASSSLRWQPAPGTAHAAQELLIPLSSITNNQRAKDKPLVRITVAAQQPQQQQQAGPAAPPAAPAVQHYVFQFESVADRDAALDVLTKVIAAGAADGAGGRGGPNGGAGGGEGPAEAGGFSRQQRQQMLQRDADLRALWEELVRGGALSEADFWGGVASRLAAAGVASAAWGTSAGPGGGGGPGAAGALGAPRRRVGLSNILQRVEAAVDGRHQRVLHVNLTPEQVSQIFAEQPAVLRAYRTHVPHRMSEEDFWKRYVRHEMHKESKRKARSDGLGPAAAAAAVVDDAGGDIFREAAAAVAAEAAARPGAAAAAREAVDPAIDLAAQEAERYEGFGTAHAAGREPELEAGHPAALVAYPAGAGGLGLTPAAEEGGDLASVINRHGSVVLQGVEALAAVEAALRGGGHPRGAAAAGSQHHHHHHHNHNHHNHHGHHHHHHHHHHQHGHGKPTEGAGAGSGGEGSPPGGGADGAPPHGGRRRRRHSAGLEDLHEAPAPQLDTLRIADPRRYFERMKDAFGGGGGGGYDHLCGGGSGGGGGGLSGAGGVLARVSPGWLPLPPLSGEAAEGALLEATPLARQLAEEEAAGPGGAPVGRAGPGGCRDPASSLPPEVLASLRRTVLSVNEACRHFWGCLPPDTVERREKAARLSRLLESKRSEVESLNDRARGLEGRFIRQLLKPPMEGLLAALVRWDEEVQRRPGFG